MVKSRKTASSSAKHAPLHSVFKDTFINLSQRDILLAFYKTCEAKSNISVNIEREWKMRLHCMVLATLWQALGPTETLKFYLNGPHALLHSEKFLRVINYLCFGSVVLALFTQSTQIKRNNNSCWIILKYNRIPLPLCLLVCLSGVFFVLKLSVSQFKKQRSFFFRQR